MSQNQKREISGTGDQSDYSWEVKANDRRFNNLFTKKSLLFFTKKKYADNSIKTSKYNFFTFLPLTLFEQFHRAANLYFLFVIILQTVPAISTMPWFALMLPLLILLTIRGIKDLVDDVARHRSDNAINNRPCETLQEKSCSFSREKWKDIQVGDVICLRKDDFVPADLLLLYTSEPASLCYVETADIDGETNLKFKQALMVTHTRLCSPEALAAFDGKVVCDDANSNMHSFIGTLEWNGEKYSLDNNCMILRGCKIRNTEYCYGMVIYAGFDSKIMKNCGKFTVKQTELDLMMNSLMVTVFVILIACSLSLAIASGFWTTWLMEKHNYIPPLRSNITPTYSAFLTFWAYTILMSTIVPMAMYITLEFVHLVHSKYINWDLHMYYVEKDMPATVRSTNLNDLLGQVEYIFSDKTGTLTQNIMTFKKCCISGTLYGTNKCDENPEVYDFTWNKYAEKQFSFQDRSLVDLVCQNQDNQLKEFFRLLAICHTVMVDKDGDELVYKAASPDEEALVNTARNFGYVFVSRTQDSITTNELGAERTYQVLALLDFSSARKRMSVLVRDPEGTIKLYTKGADDVILQRLHPGCTIVEVTEQSLEIFAQESLRTLCLAFKEVDLSVYSDWSRRYHQASVSLQNRLQCLEMVYDEMENDLKLLGATAIEDKLQDSVAETIQLLKNGNIKVWMLTGDKQETAINIGFSCGLLDDDMDILNEQKICDILDDYQEHNNNLSGSGQDLLDNGIFRKHRSSLQHTKMALVVTGDFMVRILGTSNFKIETTHFFRKLTDRFYRKARNPCGEEASMREYAFVDLATQCQAVICCRVTPKQKAMIVQLVRKHKKVTTLAIGDGANDVNMIKTAHIGVGISGLEGTQAVQASDYALAQFSYLQRLLFIHGRWSYLRIAKFLRYFFYKNFANVFCNVWFGCFNGFTALRVYDSWFIAFYSVLFTAFPVLTMALFDQDASAERSLQHPELYRVGQMGALFTYKIFAWSVVKGLITSLASFFVTYGACHDTAGPGSTCDYQSFAVITATSVLLTVTVQIIFEMSYWTLAAGLALVIGPAAYVILSLLTQSSPFYTSLPTIFTFEDATLNTLRHGFTWLMILLAIGISILPSLLASFGTSMFGNNKVHHRNSYGARRQTALNTVAMTTPFKRGSLSRRSSYAFSHKEGYADLITRGTSLRQSDANVPEVPGEATEE
ncbi:phospholipid-transporting ATPase IK [Eleutherodactylus coqui]|uniref:phospholipid-transporting ATPase IK n=1 Tax=Eleutherodactylus coqui TaxID=57060 RepID=UPI003463391F